VIFKFSREPVGLNIVLMSDVQPALMANFAAFGRVEVVRNDCVGTKGLPVVV
jgi:hypothetical protein